MIKVEKMETWGFEHAIRGMRNPMNSWEKSEYLNQCSQIAIVGGIGKNDLKLMRQLYKSGTEHRKYLRQIFVSMDITAPLYWWKQFDQYKIGVTTSSTSTMHKIHAKEFEMSDFSHEHLTVYGCDMLLDVVNFLNKCRDCYLQSKDKKWWWEMIQLLPSSYNQKRTVTMNYENVFNMIHQRENHKLDEWKEFVKILKSLPYVMEIGQFEEKGEENA